MFIKFVISTTYVILLSVTDSLNQNSTCENELIFYMVIQSLWQLQALFHMHEFPMLSYKLENLYQPVN